MWGIKGDMYGLADMPRSRVCMRVDDKITSWSECSASEAESVGCSQVGRHKYRGLFFGYGVVKDYNGDSFGGKLCYAWPG